MIALVLVLVTIMAISLWALEQIPQNNTAKTQGTSVAFDPMNATYTIDGAAVILSQGKASTSSAPGSTEETVTQIFGQPITGDINGDGKDDAAVMLVQSTGGTGTFYYVAAVLSTDRGAMGTNAVFLGDRIAPQTMEVGKNMITVNYADRKTNEPLSAAPSVGISKYLVLESSTLYDIPVSDIYPLPSRMTWGEKRAGTIMPGEENVPKPIIGVGIESQPIVNVSDISAISLPFENYYRGKLVAAGWTEDDTLAAGGPGAEIAGYKKGNNYAIFKYASVFKTKGIDSPETCPCDVTFSVFVGSLER